MAIFTSWFIIIDKWSPALQIRTVLLSIQALLSAPNPDDPLANDVAGMYIWSKLNEILIILWIIYLAGLTPEFAMIIDNITNFVFRTMESQRSRSYTKCQRLDTYLCNGELTRTIKFDKFQTIFTNFHLNIYDALFETKGIEVISLQLDKGSNPFWF